MKIGLIASAYNAEDFLHECLEAWRKFKNSSKHSLVCSFIHNCFKENGKLGYPLESQDRTHKLLEEEYENGFLDYYNFSDKNLTEAEARTVCLKDVIKDEVDYVWTIGLDEIYSTHDIENILSFVEFNSYIDWFKINYKNYVFDGDQWVDGFCPPRVFKVKSHGGLKELYYDDDFIYADGTDYKSAPHLEVPKSIAHVRHMTWLHSNGKSKVEYQKKRWGEEGCSYSWNYDKNELEFNKNFYTKKNLPLPTLNTN